MNMFKYNQSSIICNFIQNLLRTNYVPTIPVLETPPSSDLDIPLYINNNKIYRRENKQDTFVGDWELGKRYLNITSNYLSTHNYYSSETHEALGEYLRAYSHFYRIDLMAFYNCFSNRFISDISLPLAPASTDSTSGEDSDSKKEITLWYTASPAAPDRYKIACFPIKPNTDYDIKIYSNVGGSITVQPVFYNGTSFLNLLNGQVFTKQVIPASKEISYRLELNDGSSELKAALLNSKYLYLLVQVPMSGGEELRISVIERSPYFNTLNKRLMNLEDVDYNVPFSDRLLEYLTGNVIARNDKIKQNIARIQAIITSNNFISRYMGGSSFTNKDLDVLYEIETGEMKEGVTKEGVTVPPGNNIEKKSDTLYTPIKGIYDDNMRLYLYDAFASRMAKSDVPEAGEIPKLYDFNGYVDKDVEQILMQLVVKNPGLAKKLAEI